MGYYYPVRNDGYDECREDGKAYQLMQNEVRRTKKTIYTVTAAMQVEITTANQWKMNAVES